MLGLCEATWMSDAEDCVGEEAAAACAALDAAIFELTVRIACGAT